MASDDADGGGVWGGVRSWLRRTCEGGADAPPVSFFELSACDLDSGDPVPFSRYDGCVCLVVNVASK